MWNVRPANFPVAVISGEIAQLDGGGLSDEGMSVPASVHN